MFVSPYYSHSTLLLIGSSQRNVAFLKSQPCVQTPQEETQKCYKLDVELATEWICILA